MKPRPLRQPTRSAAKLRGMALLIVTFGIFFTPALVRAAPRTNLEVKVLPLECLFELVNDGSNQIVYLTPKECGQAGLDLDEPSLDPAGGSGAAPDLRAVRPLRGVAENAPASLDTGAASPDQRNVFSRLSEARNAGQALVDDPLNAFGTVAFVVPALAVLLVTSVPRRLWRLAAAFKSLMSGG